VDPPEEIAFEPLHLGRQLSSTVDCFYLFFCMIQPATSAVRHFLEVVVGHRSADAEELINLTALVFVVGGEWIGFIAFWHYVFSRRKKAPRADGLMGRG